ncbi:hypothetical protein FQN53_005468 [Emmonsiellopsis sp. PD_33]|nr:hypothetical protein FQN53_005468 [Emmonsiellopsis sp. PD_33]
MAEHGEQSQPIEMVAATEEEWARWTPYLYSIIRALTQADYEKWRNDKIAWAKEKGGDDPEQNSLLRHLLENTPPKPPIPPSEPPGLEPIVYYQLMGLEDMIKKKVLSEDYLVNARAAMAAYRSGTLKLTPGLRTYWYGGKMVVGPTPEELDIADQLQLPKWRGKYGEGAPWIEEFQLPQSQLATQSIVPRVPQVIFGLPPNSQVNKHSLSINVSVPTLGTLHSVTVLDDTGYTYMELFRDDCVALGFDPYFIPPQIYQGVIGLGTANGPIWAPRVRVEIQFIAMDNTPIGPITQIFAIVLRGLVTGDREKCSGPALRNILFTATAPRDIGNGPMIVGTRKTHVVRGLPAQ